MPIIRTTPRTGGPGSLSDPELPENESANETSSEVSLDVFHVTEAIEVYDGALALAIDQLMNHIKALISLAYLPGSADLEKALERHPALRRIKKNAGSLYATGPDGRSADRILLNDCKRLMDGVLEIAHLAAWPETADQARIELEALRKEVPFLDYRYDNDPFPSDKDHEELL